MRFSETFERCRLCGHPLLLNQRNEHNACKSRALSGEKIEYDPIPWPPVARSSDKPWLSPDYLSYLTSPGWKAFRRRALEDAGYRCSWFQCGIGTKLHVHHVTYERLGCERLSDVKVLCDYHHTLEHWRLDDERLEDARFHGWARKVYGDSYDSQYAWDEYQTWSSRRSA